MYFSKKENKEMKHSIIVRIADNITGEWWEERFNTKSDGTGLYIKTGTSSWFIHSCSSFKAESSSDMEDEIARLYPYPSWTIDVCELDGRRINRLKSE